MEESWLKKIARLVGIDIKIKLRMLNKNKSHSIMLVSSYHPYKQEELKEYNQKLADFLSNIPTSNTTIVGTDLNAKIGTKGSFEKEKDEEEDDIIKMNWSGPTAIHTKMKEENNFTT